MRILFLTNELGTGGAEKLVVSYALGLSARGHETAVAYGSYDSQAEPLRAAGVGLFPIGDEVLRARTLPAWSRRLKEAAATFRPDAVHAQSVTSAVMARLTLPHVPLLVTVHGISKSDEPLAALLLRLAGARLTAVSEVAAEGLRRHRWAPVVDVLPPGIDAERLRADAAERETQGPFGDPRIVCVARHHPVKGVDVLLRALPDILETFPDAGLTLVGTGADFQTNVSLAGKLGVAEHCRFLGMIPFAAPYIASADVVVLPSRREGLPVVALETLALERPLVATDVGGTATVAVDGETAWLVPPEDPPALAKAIVECLGDPAEAARRAKSGRELVVAGFDTRPMLDLVERLLRELVHGRQSVPPLKSHTYHRLVRLNQRQRIARKTRRGPAKEWQGVRIFGYHRVGSLDDVTAVSPEAFRAQMEHLVESDLKVVRLEEALRLLEEPVDGRYACVTFDDGYLDTLDTALPVLESLGIPATVFVVVDVLEGRATFDWSPAPPPAIRVDDLPRLLAAGLVDVQAHSVTHRRLTMLSDEELREEVVGSRTRLAKHVPTPTSFCYPAGIYGPREVEAVYEAGFRAGVTTRAGLNVGGVPLGDLRRTMLYWGDDLVAFAAKLDGVLDESTAPMRFLAARRARARA